MTDRRVVVVVVEDLYDHQGTGQVAARYEVLGLTAYGQTKEEASAALKKLFNQDVNYYRGKGLLEERLELLGIEWYWENEYPTDRLPYEDTAELSTNLDRYTPIAPKTLQLAA